MRGLVAMIVAGAALTFAACGGDTETVTETETVTTEETVTKPAKAQPTETGAAPAISESEAEAVARNAASMNLPPSFTVRPSDWSVSCSGGEGGGNWTCRVRSGPCSGTVTVIPNATLGGAARGDASRVGCIAD